MDWAFKHFSEVLEIPLGLLSAMCWVETNHTNTVNVNDGGSPSIGYCQMKIPAAKEGGCKPGERLNPQRNIECAARYLKKQYTRYHSWDKALCYYNTGHPLKTCTYSAKVNKRKRKVILIQFAKDEGITSAQN